jgi:hypothetical protein
MNNFCYHCGFRTKNSDDMLLKAQKMLWFLDCHPALGSVIFDVMSLLNIQIAQVCKRGYTEPIKGNLSLWYTPERYKQFKKEFDKEFKKYSKDELKSKALINVDIPYKKLFNESWTPNHIEYWGDLSFTIFTRKDFKKETDLSKWVKFSGVEASGRTFEEMIVNIGNKFKRIFGDFSKEKFYTSKEKKNNKEKKIFLFKKVKDSPNCSTLIRNPHYIHIGPAEMNRRWLKWFSRTQYCIKNWPNTFEKIIAGKEDFLK